MSLSNKKSRPITVNGIGFRYQISTTKVDDSYNFTLNLTVECSEFKGSILQAKGLVTRDLWLDISDSKSRDKDNSPVILPRHIDTIVKQAITGGWEYDKVGKPFNVQTNYADLFV